MMTKSTILSLLFTLTIVATLQAKIRIKTIVPTSAVDVCDGSLLIEAAGEVGPFTVNLPELELSYPDVNGTILLSDLCVGNYTVEVVTSGRFQCTKTLTAEVSVGFAALVGDDPTNGRPNPFDENHPEVTAAADFTLFPNPSDGLLTVRLEGFRTAPVRLTFYAASGQEMYEFRAFRQYVHRIPLDLTALPPGTYFAVLQDHQGEIRTKQFIIRP